VWVAVQVQRGVLEGFLGIYHTTSEIGWPSALNEKNRGCTIAHGTNGRPSHWRLKFRRHKVVHVRKCSVKHYNPRLAQLEHVTFTPGNSGCPLVRTLRDRTPTADEFLLAHARDDSRRIIRRLVEWLVSECVLHA
jgi:hypothetical protein